MTESFRQKIFSMMAEGKTNWDQSIKDIRLLEIDESNNWGKFFASIRKNLLNSHDFEQMLTQDATLNCFSFEELQKTNHEWYSEILPGKAGYDICFANPDYAVKTFGVKLGQLLSAIYSNARATLNLARIGNYSGMQATNKLFLNLYKLFQTGEPAYEAVYELYKKNILSNHRTNTFIETYCRYNPTFNLYCGIIKSSNFTNLKYLYRYGIYISPEAIQLSEFINNYDENELRKIASNHIKAYLQSFKNKKLDYRTKKFAKIHYPLGMEKLAFFYGEELKKVDLTAKFNAPDTKGANEQYEYDTRFQNALYIDQDYADKHTDLFAQIMREMKDNLMKVSGSIVVWMFGDEPFSPKNKENAIQMNEAQDKIMHNMQSKLTSLFFEAAPRNETSFSIISLPSTEIGENFNEIFKDTLALNNLDSAHYEKIQEYMIEILDQADYVEVKGKGDNQTNIRVQLHTLTDPETQTNFINCGADVNIPVGEVFTSPKLSGTNGVLHVADIFLFGLRYFNLKITFKDGMISEYSCTNYDNDKENHKYMFDNLLKPNKTLPIGEFAIGTNTLAYQMAQKHQIQHLLPILIVEKMGPHFAIGDTCFSHMEDTLQQGVVSGKDMIATDNEKSILRKTDPANAYTNKHIDITLPYDMLAEITAIKSDGTRLPIILDGLFVVPGTEELNIPLKNM